VKIHEPGRVDLGELTLPYWNPKKRAYATARAALGSIEVTLNPNARATRSPTDDRRNPALDLSPRTTLTRFDRSGISFTDDTRFFAALFGLPALVVLLAGALRGALAIRTRLDHAKSGPDRLALEALRAAESSADRDEVATTASAVERALFFAIESATGLRARALLKDDLSRALTEAGLAGEICARTLSLLDSCESARFTGKSGDLPPPELASEARETVSDLLRHRRVRRRLAA
jgi:hypothetical protein